MKGLHKKSPLLRAITWIKCKGNSLDLRDVILGNMGSNMLNETFLLSPFIVWFNYNGAGNLHLSSARLSLTPVTPAMSTEVEWVDLMCETRGRRLLNSHNLCYNIDSLLYMIVNTES